MTTVRRTLIGLAGFATFAAGVLPVDPALAQERFQRRQPRAPLAQSRPQAAPILAVVGLREQRVVVYDATGARILESAVSSGTDGYETPPGVFSVVQKELEHHSNLYDDASMPFMQRLTWTGIALHAGVIPGYPASHGCVRLPYEFAERLYGLTNLGMRVVVAREGIAPAPIAEPALFRRSGSAARAEAPGGMVQLTGARPEGATADVRETSLAALQQRASALAAAADEASYRVREARQAAGRAKSAAQPAERAVKQAEAAIARIEADLKAAEKVIESGTPPKRVADAEKVKSEAPARLEAAQAALAKVQGEAKSRLDAAREAEQEATQAALAHTKAVEAADHAKQSMSPVSVFISRKTQRIYVRKAFHPLWEAPVFIRDASQPLGSFVLTALEPAEGTRESRWNVVSLYKNPTAIEPAAARVKGAKAAPAPAELPVTNVAAAEAALDRLTVPAEIQDRISEVVLPGSSLVISDEAPSLETGKDTDFVVIMSGEPQGGIAIRSHSKPERRDRYDDDNWWGGGYSSNNGRRRGGGGGYGGYGGGGGGLFGLW